MPQERVLEIRSSDLDACVVALADCDDVEADLRVILRGWDVRELQAPDVPAVIRLRRTKAGYLRVSPWSRTPSKCRETFRTHNTSALFGVHYDLLSWYVATQRSRPCIHSAAIRFPSGLVVFPNTTKAGKTTLAIQLALAGRQVFCDDWLTIESSRPTGVALGILPWLRLPAPRDVREDFKRFLEGRRGPGNRRWMYVNLHDEELAPHGATAPVCALVLLDRQGGAKAELTSVAKDRMLSELILQNYAIGVPAAHIFDSLHAVTHSAACYSLRYGFVREAAGLLEDVFGGSYHSASGR